MNQLLIAIAGVLVAATPFVRAYIQAKFGAAKLATVHQLSAVAVNAAERIAASVPGTTGAQKYTAASNFLSDAAKRVGVKLSGDEINGFIHSALRDVEAAQGVVKAATQAA